jgi:hypothetical protein
VRVLSRIRPSSRTVCVCQLFDISKDIGSVWHQEGSTIVFTAVLFQPHFREQRTEVHPILALLVSQSECLTRPMPSLLDWVQGTAGRSAPSSEKSTSSVFGRSITKISMCQYYPERQPVRQARLWVARFSPIRARTARPGGLGHIKTEARPDKILARLFLMVRFDGKYQDILKNRGQPDRMIWRGKYVGSSVDHHTYSEKCVSQQAFSG